MAAPAQTIQHDGKQSRVVAALPADGKASPHASVAKAGSLLRPALGGKAPAALSGSETLGSGWQIAGSIGATAEAPRRMPDVSPLLAALVAHGQSDALAYAPAVPDNARVLPFDALLNAAVPSSAPSVPLMQGSDHAWMATPLPPSVFSQQEQTCLATGIYFEARGENLRGQAAVAQVILNRVRSPAYPKSICGVVYQNQQMRNACQFSFACDDVADTITNPAAFRTAQNVAMAATSGRTFLPEIGSATHYYADYVSPRWARAMERVMKIGRHIFFRTHGGGLS